MSARVSRQESHLAPGEIAEYVCVARTAERRLEGYLTNIREAFHLIQSATADYADIRLRQSRSPEDDLEELIVTRERRHSTARASSRRQPSPKKTILFFQS